MSPVNCTVDEARERQDNACMVAVAAPSKRLVKPIPALLVMLLADAGKLPPAIAPAEQDVLGFRLPGIADMEALTWVAAWEGDRVDQHGFRKVAGLVSYREYWDIHTGSDVTDICSLSGSRRAIVDLVRWIQFDAESRGRRAMGSFAIANVGLRRLLSRLGHIESRVVVEVA